MAVVVRVGIPKEMSRVDDLLLELLSLAKSLCFSSFSGSLDN
jgi:hypothetical protein